MGADDGMLNPVIPELSGLIANAKFVFANHQFWIILPPLVVFMILILCFQMMANSLLKREEESKKPSSIKELGYYYLRSDCLIDSHCDRRVSWILII